MLQSEYFQVLQTWAAGMLDSVAQDVAMFYRRVPAVIDSL